MLSDSPMQPVAAPPMTAVPVRSNGVIEAEVDGDLVLMSPVDYAYFGASGTGRAIWELIDGERSVAAIVKELMARYAGHPDTIRGEALEFIGAMVYAGLIKCG